MGLRQSYREAVILRDVEGFSYEEGCGRASDQHRDGEVTDFASRLELRRKLEGSL